MQSEERHELQQNDLAAALNKSSESVRPYLNVAIAVFLIVLVVGGTWFYLEAAAEARRREAWTAFFEANTAAQYKEVVKTFEDTPVRPYALVRLADIDFEAARQKLLDNWGDATERLDEAYSYYQQAYEAAAAGDPVIARQALLGMAMTKETRGDAMSDAKKLYERLISEYPASIGAQIAQQQLEGLNDPAVMALYQQIIAHEPTPSPGIDFDDLLKDSFSPGAGGGTPTLPSTFGDFPIMPPLPPPDVPAGDSDTPSEPTPPAPTAPAPAPAPETAPETPAPAPPAETPAPESPAPETPAPAPPAETPAEPAAEPAPPAPPAAPSGDNS